VNASLIETLPAGKLSFKGRPSFGFNRPSLLYLQGRLLRTSPWLYLKRQRNRGSLAGETAKRFFGIAEKHGARNVRIFRIVAHGEATEASDIDLLVDTAEQTSPCFPPGLPRSLEELLRQRVDVVTSNGLYWLLPPAHFKGSQTLVKIRSARLPRHIRECAQKIERYTKGEKNFTTIRCFRML